MTALQTPPRPTAPAADRRESWLTVDQYHSLIGDVIVEGEPYELLQGRVVRKDRSQRGADPMSIYPPHVLGVTHLEDLKDRLKPLGCTLRVQQPLTLSAYNEPEPDGAIVIGTKYDYAIRHPTPAEVLMVFEVAHSSLRHDRTAKQKIYAAAGIERYVIVNLIDHVVELHTRPLVEMERYGLIETLGPARELTLPTPGGEGVGILVGELV